jgi:hypothetical protein
MALCGRADGQPLLPPLSVPSKLTAVASEIERVTAGGGRRVRPSWPAAVAGRAALLGLSRRGTTSPNGTCRLLHAADGIAALNLPRPSDVELLPALVEGGTASPDPWAAAAAAAAEQAAAAFVARARLLGMAAAVPSERQDEQPYVALPRGSHRPADPERPWTVVDLSSLWAGPLTARILREVGARLIKVEDPSRPDGARLTPAFYNWLHPRSETTVPIDFSSPEDRKSLAALLETADVVIEASRPRALEQLGLSPDMVDAPDGQVWLSITAHGRRGAARDWVGFGDDAAVAGGLTCEEPGGATTFCADALADPITGLVAALAVLRSRSAGGGELLDVSLSGAAAWTASGPVTSANAETPTVARSEDGWTLLLDDERIPISEHPPSLELVALSHEEPDVLTPGP